MKTSSPGRQRKRGVSTTFFKSLHGGADLERATYLALQRERASNGTLLALLRLVGVSAFLALDLAVHVLAAPAGQARFPSHLLGYWLASVLLVVLSQRSAKYARGSFWAVPLLDGPLIFLIQWGNMLHTESERAVAVFTVALNIGLIMLAGLSLHRPLILLTSALGIVSQLLLQLKAQDTLVGQLGGIILIGLAGWLCDFACKRQLSMINRVCHEQLRRERLGRYFSPQVVAQIEDQPHGLTSGRRVVITVLFADIRDFTALSEQLDNSALVALLNDFHGRMVETVFHHGGTLDKYIGDGLMAYFGAPLPQPDHATRAIRCALAMQEQLQAMNRQRVPGQEAPLAMGIGIHTGPALVGSIGAPHRREFTAIGDTVNLAARLEQLTKVFHEAIIISEETRRQAADEFVFKPLEATAVKGKAEPVKACVPLALSHSA